MTGLLCLSAMVAFAQAGPVAGPAVSASPVTNGTTLDETKLTINDAPGTSAAAGQNIQSFGIWDLVRMIIILALVVASIYGVFWLIRRGNKKAMPDTELIQLLGSQGLPGNRWLHVVNVQKQVFLIGSSDASVNLIAEITDQESVDELRLIASREQAPAHKNFADMIGGFFGGNGPSAGGSGASKAGGLDFLRRQRDRLKKM